MYVHMCCTGLWFVGELISGIYGIVSVHGLIVANTIIPGSMTYLHGCYIVSYYNIIIIIIEHGSIA